MDAQAEVERQDIVVAVGVGEGGGLEVEVEVQVADAGEDVAAHGRAETDEPDEPGGSVAVVDLSGGQGNGAGFWVEAGDVKHG